MNILKWFLAFNFVFCLIYWLIKFAINDYESKQRLSRIERTQSEIMEKLNEVKG
jgi:hypothetical protein